MRHSVLDEAIFLLEEIRTYQGNTGGCAIKSLDQAIRDLETLKGGRYSGPEMSAEILLVLGMLFSEFPELRRSIEYLAKL